MLFRHYTTHTHTPPPPTHTHIYISYLSHVNGNIQIVNLFKDKYEHLLNSVQCSKEESELMKTQIDSEVANVCNTTKTCESSNCVHFHLISSTDVSTAVSKLKTDKVNDNGMIYSNNFIHGTELLFQYCYFNT